MRTIFTIGYEGTDIERFIKTLQAVGIDTVADVRAVPLSRKKGFSKNSLKDRLEEVGIRYLPAKELGDPKPGREAAKIGDYDTFRSIYGAHINLPEQALVVGQIADIAKIDNVCLLCFERDPATCHRMIVGEKMEPHGFLMFHLYADDPQKYVRNRDKLPTAKAAA